jgi:hypothetical protein
MVTNCNIISVSFDTNFLYKTGEGLKDAYYQYQDLIDKYAATPLLLNGIAIYNMKTDKAEEASSALQEASEKVWILLL